MTPKMRPKGGHAAGRKTPAPTKRTKRLELIRRRVGRVDLGPVAQGKQVVIVVANEGVASRTLEPVAGAQTIADRLKSSVSEIEAAVALIEQSNASAHSSRAHEGLSAGERAALKEGGFDDRHLEPGEPDPALEVAARFAKILNESLTVQETAARLGHVNESRIRQRLTSSPPTLYAIKLGREWRLPAFQFESKGTVHGIDKVISALPSDLDPVSVESWFSIPNPDLAVDGEDRPLSPLEWLRRGGAPARAAGLAKDL